jgi:hypothetical protein
MYKVNQQQTALKLLESMISNLLCADWYCSVVA